MTSFHGTGSVPAGHRRGVSLLLSLLATFVFGAPGFAASVERIEVDDHAVSIRFDDRVGAASTFLLDGPQRIAIDVAGVTPGGKAKASGAVMAVRQGVHGGGGARIVLDLARPVTVTQGHWEDDGKRLTLDLADTDRAGFAIASTAAPMSFLPFGLGKMLGESKPRYKISQAVPPAAKLRLPEVRGDDTRPLVVIDAGHGGNDPGAINPDTGLREKDVTLKIAKAIRDELLDSGRVRVALTRDDDRYILHRERFGIARRLGASLFISIHCDSAGNASATGATAYTLSEVASDKEAARLAARENKADIIAGVDLDSEADVSTILIDLTQRETMNASAGFARLLGREARPLIPTKDSFHRMASLLVLKAPDMPSILFETGYISNPQDAAFLDSREGRHKIAESVSQAVGIHFARRMASR